MPKIPHEAHVPQLLSPRAATIEARALQQESSGPLFATRESLSSRQQRPSAAKLNKYPKDYLKKKAGRRKIWTVTNPSCFHPIHVELKVAYSLIT